MPKIMIEIRVSFDRVHTMLSKLHKSNMHELACRYNLNHPFVVHVKLENNARILKAHSHSHSMSGGSI